MITYNKTSLHNKEVQQQSTSAFESKLISAEELQQIKKAPRNKAV